MTAHPEQIGPYRILEELGEGAWARVYLADLFQRQGCFTEAESLLDRAQGRYAEVEPL